MSSCSICGKQQNVGRGLCRNHYQKMWKQGLLKTFKLCKDPLFDRLMAKVKIQETGCWIWQGLTRKDGYGMIWKNGKAVRAHREMYRLSHPELSDSKVICHKCDVPSCVNPKHLFEGSNFDNRRDSVEKGRHAAGMRSGLSVLTTEQILAIRLDQRSQSKIAADYGISQPHISKIKNRKRRTTE